MNSIPSFDLSQQYKLIGEEIGAAVSGVLASGSYIGGAAVADFEQALAQYVGVSDCVSCNSGTDALLLAMRALEIGPGDRVITTPFTFVATAEVISTIGAVPVFVDIDPDTYNLDLDQVEAAVNDRTKAILPVHLFGQPVDMSRLLSIAQRHGIPVIEDCAQAVGAQWGEAAVGSLGRVGCFSFYPTKNLGACGDGGALTTNDPTIAAKARMVRNHGQQQRYLYEAVGVNSRLDALQAVILSIKLRYLPQWNQARAQVADRYQRLLSPIPGIQLPRPIAGGTSVWNQYTIRVQPPSQSKWDKIAFQANMSQANKSQANKFQPPETYRDRVQQRLQQQGIGSTVYYPVPLHLQPVYAELGYQPGQLPVAEQLALEVLSLPMFPELTAEAQTQVAYALKDALSVVD